MQGKHKIVEMKIVFSVITCNLMSSNVPVYLLHSVPDFLNASLLCLHLKYQADPGLIKHFYLKDAKTVFQECAEQWYWLKGRLRMYKERLRIYLLFSPSERGYLKSVNLTTI